MLNSKDLDTLMYGIYMIGELKDKISVPIIIKYLDDPRISHDYRFKGMSIYQQSVYSLRKIAGLKFEKIDYKPDSLIIQKWKTWFKEVYPQLKD